LERAERNIEKINKWSKEKGISKQRKDSLERALEKQLELKKIYESE